MAPTQQPTGPQAGTVKVAHAKTGGMGTSWMSYDSPKPTPVSDHYAYWAEQPPARSDRCAWWLRQIEIGWRPNRRIRAENYDSSAQWYGVYIWEYLNEIDPALDAALAGADQ